ncbi:hypothetical protein HDV05_000601 [Chytridiales sp. JEL 0842]|nr:hypothetical protein HDV05_000601 [Chytridiales sp. JEL 0842]
MDTITITIRNISDPKLVDGNSKSGLDADEEDFSMVSSRKRKMNDGADTPARQSKRLKQKGTMRLTVDKKISVLGLKQKIYDKWNTVPIHQSLYFRGSELENNAEKISTLNPTPGDVFEVKFLEEQEVLLHDGRNVTVKTCASTEVEEGDERDNADEEKRVEKDLQAKLKKSETIRVLNAKLHIAEQQIKQLQRAPAATNANDYREAWLQKTTAITGRNNWIARLIPPNLSRQVAIFVFCLKGVQSLTLLSGFFTSILKSDAQQLPFPLTRLGGPLVSSELSRQPLINCIFEILLHHIDGAPTPPSIFNPWKARRLRPSDSTRPGSAYWKSTKPPTATTK